MFEIFTKNTQGILRGNIYLAAHLPLMMVQRVIMRKAVLALTLLFVFGYSKAQFYYNDVIDLTASNKLYATLIKNNIKEISATSKESDNSPTEGFVYLKSIKKAHVNHYSRHRYCCLT